MNKDDNGEYVKLEDVLNLFLANMIQAEEKIEMYNKLSKKELILMLIEANKYLDNRQPYITYPDQVPYNELCSCNPKNGGSGICGCTMGNEMVKRNNNYTSEFLTYTTYNSVQNK